ncbi:MAG TPA: hypothetical protein VMX76_04040 [Nevskiaceae bacterium]|nr:hypothetical protein [Nevskiaceae bacterium]
MVKFLLHSLFLVAAVFLAFLWTSHPTLSVYTLQLTAAFVLLFFFNQFIARKKRQKANLAIEAVVFTMVVLLLVTSTGGLTSPLFFLVYFLMFGLALLFEPAITFSLAVGMILFFVVTTSQESLLEEILSLFSLLLITPLALFFGKQYLKLLESREKIKILKQETAITNEQIKKEETDVLMWTTLELKKDLSEILDHVSHLLSDLAHLTVSQKERLLKIRGRTLHLLKTGEKLKEEVDKATDET